MRKHYIAVTAVFVIFFCSYELYQGFASFRSESLYKAKDIVTVIMAVRKWNSDVCDLYASTSFVAPNPYLKSDRREIAADDLELTKVNPAYMTRMTSEILSRSSNITVRMISSTPINPINKPLEWERKGLIKIAKSDREFSKIDYSKLTDIRFNYIRPVYVEKSCLSCHEYQGYKLGDLRGGISVSFPVTREHHRIFFATVLKISAYLISAVLVIIIIFNSRRRLLNAYQEKLNTIAELEKEITRREKSEAALVFQTRNASASEVLSLIAHHWRQPLNNIGLLIQSMKDDTDDKDIKESGATALTIVKEMSETIDLFTSSVRAKNPERLEIKGMVYDVLKLLQPELESSGINVFVLCRIGGDVSAPAPTESDHIFHSCGLGNTKCENLCAMSGLHVIGEESMFKQILFVLLKNSYDALLQVSKDNRNIKISFEKQGRHVLISICDNGSPITEDAKSKLFEPYFSTKGIEAGRGIGLFSARSLVSNFEDAHLYYDDTNGKCFVFKFKTC